MTSTRYQGRGMTQIKRFTNEVPFDSFSRDQGKCVIPGYRIRLTIREIRGEYGPRKTGEPTLFPKRAVQRRYIAKSHEYLGLLYQIPVNEIKDSRSPITTPHTENRIGSFIQESLLEIPRSFLITPRQIARMPENSIRIF